MCHTFKGKRYLLILEGDSAMQRVTKALLNSRNFKIAITQLYNVQQV